MTVLLDTAGALIVKYRQTPNRIQRKFKKRMVDPMKRKIIQGIALINCIVAIAALIIQDLVQNKTVSSICKWVLIIAWIVQGIYIFSKYKSE